MKPRTTRILVLIALVCGGLVALDHYRGTSTDEAQGKSRRVLDFQSKDIRGLTIELTNRVYAVEKIGDQWQIRQPLDVRANYSTVSSILDELEFAERNRTLTAKELRGEIPAGFGLQPPRIRVTLQGGKRPLVLLVGNETPTKDAVYVRLENHPDVYIAPRSIYDRLNPTLDDLRDRTVIDFLPASATRLEIKSADRVIELAKSSAATNAEPRWTLTRPLAARADQRKVSELLADLNELRVTDFVSEDPQGARAYHLDEPEREITVWTGESGKTLVLGHPLTNDAAKVYAKLKSADSVYTVPSSVAQKFAVQANDLRDAQILAFADSDVHGIELLHGTDRIALSQTNSAWSIAVPVAAAAEPAAVEQLLSHLGGLTAKQFAADVATDLDKYGLAAPMATISLLGAGTNTITQLLVGSSDPSNTVRFVKRADEPFVYGVDPDIISWLPANYLALRSHRLTDVAPEAITRLTIEAKTGKTVVERGADKKWKLVEPAQGVLDDDALQHLLDEWGALRAEEFIREGRDNLTEYGLDQPAATITATARDKTQSLSLGKPRGSDSRFALWSNPPLVLAISASGANTLMKDVVTPTNPAPATASTTNAPSASAPPPTDAVSPLSSPTNPPPKSPSSN
ncbi:MAG TPA: DUF4340 domain-containing protein [Verrucomicrobiae bacterium]|nr:DUF4340 domain-containing protein [Verrucomicrobiae bacterium]